MNARYLYVPLMSLKPLNLKCLYPLLCMKVLFSHYKRVLVVPEGGGWIWDSIAGGGMQEVDRTTFLGRLGRVEQSEVYCLCSQNWLRTQETEGSTTMGKNLLSPLLHRAKWLPGFRSILRPQSGCGCFHIMGRSEVTGPKQVSFSQVCGHMGAIVKHQGRCSSCVG